MKKLEIILLWKGRRLSMHEVFLNFILICILAFFPLFLLCAKEIGHFTNIGWPRIIGVACFMVVAFYLLFDSDSLFVSEKKTVKKK